MHSVMPRQPGTTAVAVPLKRHESCLNLAAARQQKELTLEQIAETTKISLAFLRAIEAEAFERLPGGIFNTSYLRQYARCIGYDEASLVAHYNEIMFPAPEVVPEPERPSLSTLGMRNLLRWLRIPRPA